MPLRSRIAHRAASLLAALALVAMAPAQAETVVHFGELKNGGATVPVALKQGVIYRLRLRIDDPALNALAAAEATADAPELAQASFNYTAEALDGNLKPVSFVVAGSGDYLAWVAMPVLNGDATFLRLATPAKRVIPFELTLEPWGASAQAETDPAPPAQAGDWIHGRIANTVIVERALRLRGGRPTSLVFIGQNRKDEPAPTAVVVVVGEDGSYLTNRQSHALSDGAAISLRVPEDTRATLRLTGSGGAGPFHVLMVEGEAASATRALALDDWVTTAIGDGHGELNYRLVLDAPKRVVFEADDTRTEASYRLILRPEGDTETKPLLSRVFRTSRVGETRAVPLQAGAYTVTLRGFKGTGVAALRVREGTRNDLQEKPKRARP